MTEPVVGVACDGTGYGDDGRIWGAEMLVCDLAATALGASPLRTAAGRRSRPRERPGGLRCGYLSLEPAAAPAFGLAFDGREPAGAGGGRAAGRRRPQRATGLLAGPAVRRGGGVLGVRQSERYEGQAAMELEALAGRRLASAVSPPVLPPSGGAAGSSTRCRCWSRWASGAAAGDPGRSGGCFPHRCRRRHHGAGCPACEREGLRFVALGGGVFQNARLLVSVREGLEARGLRVLMPRRLGPNDGAVSYGQAAVAASADEREGG